MVTAAPCQRGVAGCRGPARLDRAYGALPTAFELNQGQTDPRVAFLARGAGATLFLTAHDAVLSLPSAPVGRPGPKGPWQGRTLKGLRGITAPRTLQSSSLKGLSGVAPSQTLQGPSLPWSFRARPTTSARPTAPAATPAAPPAVVRFGLLGTNPHTRVVGLDKLPGVVNYYLGDDPRRWRTGVPTYAEVSYRAVYKGVDLVYHGRQGQLEYDFDVAAGADPSAIALLIEGGTAPRLDRAGNLVVGAGAGVQVLHEAPVAYQMIDGARRPVTVRYLLQGGTTARGYRVGFTVGRYDPRRALVIDPVLYYATAVGGSYTATGIAVDGYGRAYVTGSTYSPTFTTSNPYQPCLNRSCPSTSNNITDAYVSVFQPDGTKLVYSTYLGGAGNDGAAGIALDNYTVNGVLQPDAYITGYTTSTGDANTGFPIRGGYQQTNCSGCKSAFVAELNNAGSLAASTFLHGTSDGSSISTEGTAIALDSNGNPYVTGDTQSVSFPTSSHALQASNEEAYTYNGATYTPATGFVAGLSSDLTTLNYGAYIGGCDEGSYQGSEYSTGTCTPNGGIGGGDLPTAITVDNGLAYITGRTSSSTFYANFASHASIACGSTSDCDLSSHPGDQSTPLCQSSSNNLWC